MKRPAPFSARPLAFALAITSLSGVLACSSGERERDDAIRDHDQHLIKGFAASSSAFDAVGAIGLVLSNAPGGPSSFAYFCSAAVIGPRTVLTAKHCLNYARQVQGQVSGFAFAVGPDARHPARLVPIVDGEGAPGDTGGNVVPGTDVAVLYTSEEIAGIAPLAFAALEPAQVGQKFALMGFGAQDNAVTQGTRRTGGATLKALEGKLYELTFGSFERFREFALSDSGRAPALVPGLRVPPALAAVLSDGTEPDAGRDEEGGATADATAPHDPLDDALRAIYDGTRLNAGYEAAVGLGGAEAQACFGDSGGPLLRRDDGKLVVYGVASGVLSSDRLLCDFGAIYGTFGPGVFEFLESAVHFADPCGDLQSAGRCEGDVARRCTKPFGLEGPRQPLAFDCSLLGTTCIIQPDGQSACGTP